MVLNYILVGCPWPRPDIKFDVALVESCWAEIDAGEGKKKIMIGCIYKHPTCNLEQFRNRLNNIIKTINPNRHEIYIFGDMNINFLKFNEHTQTEEFLDMLYANNILPIITKPTRLTDHTATLIDHKYINCLQNFTVGILTVDITDHLPIFCLVWTQPTRNNSNKKYFRDYSKFNKDLYLDDIKLIDWHEILNPEKNLNEKVQEAINTLNKIVDKHAPIKLASQSKQRQLNKPWLTKGILKSVKRKQKMYRTHFLSKYFTLLEILKLENIFKSKIGALEHKIQYQKKKTPPALYDLVSLEASVKPEEPW